MEAIGNRPASWSYTCYGTGFLIKIGLNNFPNTDFFWKFTIICGPTKK